MVRNIIGYDDEASKGITFSSNINNESIEIEISSSLISESHFSQSLELTLIDIKDLIEWLKSEVELIEKSVFKD